MKSTTTFLIIAAAAAAYFLFKNPPADIAYNPAATAQQQAVKSAITKLDKDLQTGTVERTSKTLAKKVTANVGGEILTGNIAQLGTGKTAFIAVKQPARDASGKTAIDKVIEANFKASGTKPQVFKSFWD